MTSSKNRTCSSRDAARACVRSLFLSLARAHSAFTRSRRTFNVKKPTHTFSCAHEAITVDSVSPYRRTRRNESIRRRSFSSFNSDLCVVSSTRCNILPFNGSRHPRLEEEPRGKKKKHTRAIRRILSKRGIGEKGVRGVHALRSHWPTGWAFDLGAVELECCVIIESPLANGRLRARERSRHVIAHGNQDGEERFESTFFFNEMSRSESV